MLQNHTDIDPNRLRYPAGFNLDLRFPTNLRSFYVKTVFRNVLMKSCGELRLSYRPDLDLHKIT